MQHTHIESFETFLCLQELLDAEVQAFRAVMRFETEAGPQSSNRGAWR